MTARVIRARSRPRPIVWLWLSELLAALVLATPLAAWARAAWGDHPDGDAVLFRPGGRELLTWLDDPGSALAIVARTSAVIFLVATLLAPLVTGAVVAGLVLERGGEEGRAPRLGRCVRASLGAFLPLLALGFIVFVFQLVVLAIGVAATAGVEHVMHAPFGDAQAFRASASVFVVFLVTVLAIGVTADLARVGMARAAVEPDGAQQSGRALFVLGLRRGLRTARVAGLRALAAWGWRAAAATVLLLAGAAASDVVRGRDGAPLIALFVVHQLLQLGRAGLRVSWLAHALRLEGGGPQAERVDL